MRYRSIVLISLALAGIGCRKATSNGPAPATSAVITAAQAAPSASAGARPELTPGSYLAYGLAVPNGFRILANFPGELHAGGDAPPQDVADYVQKRVEAGHVELRGAGIVFPNARVRGGDQNKLLRVEVNSAGDGTELVVRDVTPVPKRAPDTSVPEAERWRRAGLNPDGTPLDPMSLR